MKITDKEAKKQLKMIGFMELSESIETYPEEERNGRTDLEIILQEAEYFLDMYDEDTVYYEDLEQAKEFLRESKNGKIIPCWNTLPPMPKFSTIEFEIKVQEARNSINDYKRLKAGVQRLYKLV